MCLTLVNINHVSTNILHFMSQFCFLFQIHDNTAPPSKFQRLPDFTQILFSRHSSTFNGCAQQTNKSIEFFNWFG